MLSSVCLFSSVFFSKIGKSDLLLWVVLSSKSTLELISTANQHTIQPPIELSILASRLVFSIFSPVNFAMCAIALHSQRNQVLTD